MRRSLFIGSLGVFSVMLLASSTAFAADNWLGTWKLNLAKSKYSPGPAPKSLTVKFEASQDGITLTSDGVDADGMPTHDSYTSKFDGKDVPWAGNPNADTASPKRIDANSFQNTWKKDGKVTVNVKAVVSADGKTLTVTLTGKNAKGEAVNNTAVYDRQ
jgi:hypothetical protein